VTSSLVEEIKGSKSEFEIVPLSLYRFKAPVLKFYAYKLYSLLELKLINECIMINNEVVYYDLVYVGNTLNMMYYPLLSLRRQNMLNLG
jgi:hypothetical protein